MPTNYNELKTKLEYGLKPITKDEDGDYAIWIFITNSGSLRRSIYTKSMSECVDTLGLISNTEKEINDYCREHQAEIVGYYKEPIKHYEVGQLVDILESARECGNYDEWCDTKKVMVGQKGLEVKEVYNNGLYYTIHPSITIWNKDKSDYFSFRLEYLSPHTSEIGLKEQEAIDIVNRLAEQGKIKNKVELI